MGYSNKRRFFSMIGLPGRKGFDKNSSVTLVPDNKDGKKTLAKSLLTV